MKSITNSGFFDLLHIADDISDLTRSQRCHGRKLRLHESNLKDRVRFVKMTADNCHTLLQFSTHHIEQTDHVFVVDEPAVNKEEFDIICGFAYWGSRHLIYYACQQRLHVQSCFSTHLA